MVGNYNINVLIKRELYYNDKKYTEKSYFSGNLQWLFLSKNEKKKRLLNIYSKKNKRVMC